MSWSVPSFHQMALRHTAGVLVEHITASAQDAELVKW